MSPEMAALKMGKKTIEVLRPEELLNQVSANMLGSQVNGR